MERPFLAIYRFFSSHKAVFYSILFGTTILFAFWGTKLQFEENILDLLPKTDKSDECAVAFGDIKIKDKLTLEIPVPAGKTPQETAVAMDKFLEILNGKDEGKYIASILYGFDTDDIMNVVYYGMGALPCHLPQEFYSIIEPMLNEKAMDSLVSDIESGSFKLPSMDGFTMVNSHMFSPDSTLSLAYLTPAFKSIDTKCGKEFQIILDESIEKFKEANPDYEVLFHGNAPEGIYNSLRTQKDLFLTVGLSLALICLLMFIAFKNKRTLVELLAPVVYGILFSMAMIYLIKGSMSMISLGIGAIVMGVAMSYCLHIITHHKYVENVEDVIREQARPVFLGCLTTIGAFAGLLLTTSDLLRDFGIFASLALVGTTFFALAFLPQFMSGKDTKKNDKVFNIVNKINTYPLDKNKVVIAILVVLAAVCVYKSSDVKFDNDLSHIGYREKKVIHSENLYNASVNQGHFCQYFGSYAHSLDSAIIFNRRLAFKLDSLKKEGVIYGYSNPQALLVPMSEQQANIDRWKAFWTPERTASTYELLKKENRKYKWQAEGFDIPETFKLMAEADYEPQSITDSGYLPASLLSNFVEQTPDGWLVFSSALLDRKELYTICDAIADEEHIVVMDPFYYAGDMVEIAHSDFQTVLLISSLFVFLVLLISFRSLIISLIAFMPMMLSWYIVQGLMAMLGIEFNIINIMISTFIFGIGVDYSIFVMEGLINRTKYQSHRLLVCHKAAIFFSAVTLMIFTGSLLFAVHPAIYSIGSSTIMGMASTILITYSLEPLLFKLAIKSEFIRKHAIK